MIRRWLARLIGEAARQEVRTRERILLPDDDAAPVYAVGDVHGCLDLLIEAEARILRDAAGRNTTVVMLGDYVDRGPASAGVLGHLIRPPPAPLRRVCLAGNHDDAMLRFLADPANNREWLEFGGDATLRSYGIDAAHLLRTVRADAFAALLGDAVPASHRDFLAGLPIAASCRGFVFVHAGLKPGVPFEEQDDEDLMWIREPFLSTGAGGGVTVVHGHTPSETPSFGPGRIGIDTAAYMTGRLTVLKIDRGQPAIL